MSASCILCCRWFAYSCLIACEFCKHMTISTVWILPNGNVLQLILTVLPGWLSPNKASASCYRNEIFCGHKMMTPHHCWLNSTSTSLTWYLMPSGIQRDGLLLILIWPVMCSCCCTGAFTLSHLKGFMLKIDETCQAYSMSLMEYSLDLHDHLVLVAPAVWQCCQRLQGKPKSDSPNGFDMTVVMSCVEMEECTLYKVGGILGGT